MGMRNGMMAGRMVSAGIVMVLLGLAALSAPPLHAGGWPQEVGKSFIKITYGSSSSNTVYRFDGATKPPTDNGGATVTDFPLADRGLFLYIEHGLTENLTLVGEAAVKRSIITSPLEERTTEGLGDIGLAARYRVWHQGPHVLSARAGITLPTGYRRDITPPLGNGVPTVSLGAEYGVSFYPIPAYATASAGYRMRPSIYGLSTLEDDTREFAPNFADIVYADAEVGYTIAKRVLVKAGARFLTTTRSDDNDFDVRHPPETERYLKVGGGLAAAVWNGFDISADLFVTPLGLKTANSTDLFIGISWKGSLFGAAAASPGAAPTPPPAEPTPPAGSANP